MAHKFKQVIYAGQKLVDESGGGGAVTVVDTPDEHGGTIREITAVNIEEALEVGSATPSETAQTITPSAGKLGFSKVNVGAIPSDYVGTSVPKQAATTITPSTIQQTAVVEGKYTTGDVIVDSIPSEYIVPTGTKTIDENGTGIDVSAFAAVDVNVPTGASNIVFGTFTTNSTAGVQTISIPYTGNGYPMMAQIFTTGGINATGQQAWHDSVVSRQIGAWSFIKRIMSPAPTYDDASEKNLGASTWTFKNSSSDPSVFGAQGNASAQIYRASGAASGGASCCRFTNDKTISIYVDGTGDVYGFPNSVEFSYMIVYSE